MKKNLHLVPGINAGGIERVIERYISNYENMNLPMVDQVFIKHDLVDGLLTKKFREKGFKVYTIKSKSDNILFFTINFIKILLKERPSSIHIHQNFSSWFPLIISYLLRIKIRVIHSHQYYSKQKKITKILNNIYSISWIFATHKLACSKEAGQWMYGKNKFTVLPNSMNINKFKFNHEIRNSIREEYKLNNKFVVGHIGRYSTQKNQFFLMDVFNNLLKNNNPNSHLIIFGEGEKETEIKKYVKKLKISDFVSFLEPRIDVYKFYNAFDVFFLPSLWEGLGIVAIESQINGLTTVVSDVLPKALEKSENLRKISLESDINTWSDSLFLNTNQRRAESFNDFVHSEFDSIDSNTKKLYEIYLGHIF